LDNLWWTFSPMCLFVIYLEHLFSSTYFRA
jgi:hypothetical protein